MNKHICYLPWVGLDITPQGEYKPCCKYENIISTNIDDYLTSKELADLKSSFLAGERPLACNRCWRDEDSGIKSKRQIDWKNVLKETVPDLTHFKSISLPFGNTCNLACRTCKSYASSRWLSEEKKLSKYIPVKMFPHNKYYQDTMLLDKMKKLCEHVELLEVPGGEPFITGVEEQLEFLDHLISNNAKNIVLHYMTNATTMPDQRFWDKWKHFKKVDIQLSIDGIDKVYEYTRWPGVWSTTYNNIKEYQKHWKNNIQLSISHTVSIFNVFYLNQFIDWCKYEELPDPYLGLVSKPDQYSITTLSPKTKEYLSKHLTKSNIVQYMNTTDHSILLSKTLIHVIMIDSHRKQKFSEYLPEFYDVLKSTCIVLSKLP
jgi:sulfatase maturation enzyme AslB (radical SAM superfamily)